MNEIPNLFKIATSAFNLYTSTLWPFSNAHVRSAFRTRHERWKVPLNKPLAGSTKRRYKLRVRKWAALSCIFLQGCGIISPALRSESKLSNLSIGDKKSDVIGRIGTPDVLRGSRRFEDGRTLEVAEYRLYDDDQWAYNALLGIPTLTLSWWIPFQNKARHYWLQYVDGKLDRWGHAGDWQPDVIADVTIRQK